MESIGNMIPKTVHAQLKNSTKGFNPEKRYGNSPTGIAIQALRQYLYGPAPETIKTHSRRTNN